MQIYSIRSKRLHRGHSGQALIESALVIPFVLMIIFNAVNFGYVFYVAQNMSAAARSGALYSILGPNTPYSLTYASPGSSASDVNGVANVIYQDMLGALPSSDANASVRVCSISVGTTITGGITYTSCSSVLGPSATFPAVTADPEAPGTTPTAANNQPANFFLNRVDVQYSFSPLIPGTPFGAALYGLSNCTGSPIVCTFKSSVSMRAM